MIARVALLALLGTAAVMAEAEGEGEEGAVMAPEGEAEGAEMPAPEGETEGEAPVEAEEAEAPVEAEEAEAPVEAEEAEAPVEAEEAEAPVEAEEGEAEEAEEAAAPEMEGTVAVEAEGEGTEAPVEAEGAATPAEGEGAAAASGAYAAEIAEGLTYFSDLAATGRPKVVALRDAVMAGEVEMAKDAYIKSRNEYEQIEVLAPGFSDIDCSIDCRAYAYDNGEGQPMDEASIGLDEFQGFHRIENYLFRDMVTEPAVPYAKGLVQNWDALSEVLADPSAFEFCGWFEGVIGLANEVAAKKISSEEETYSDQSILIYDNNFKGIKAAVAPFMPALMDAAPGAAANVDAAFAMAEASIAEYVNADGTYAAYSTVGNGKRKDIQLGAYAVRDAIMSMQDALPNAPTCTAEEEAEEECVHPEPVEALEERTIGADYFKALYTRNKAQIDAFVELVGTPGTPLADLKAAYAEARPLYEQIETLAPAYPDEDAAIDARPDAYELGEFDPEFQGMHRFERMLWRDEITQGNNSFTTMGMNAWATKLQETYVALGAKIDMLPGSIGAADVFDGVLGVMTEVAAKKISSEEESFSNLSLMIFHNNWLGGYAQILPFAETDGSEANLTAAYEEAVGCIAPHVTGTVPACLPMTTAEEATDACMDSLSQMKYKGYRSIDMATRECIVEKGMALRDVMVDIANNLNIPHTCHAFHKDNVWDYRHAELVQGPGGAERSTTLESEEGEGAETEGVEGEGESEGESEGTAESEEGTEVVDRSGVAALAATSAVGAIAVAALLM